MNGFNPRLNERGRITLRHGPPRRQLSEDVRVRAPAIVTLTTVAVACSNQ
jgi:hypothetical protein